MTIPWTVRPLGEVISHRKEVITVTDTSVYKRCRVQLHTKGIVLRDEIEGARIKTKSQQVCKAGEFLVAEIDAKVGGYGIVPKDLDGAIVSSHYFLFDINRQKLDERFLDYYIRTPGFRDQVGARGSTNYAAIRPYHVLGYEIPLPPLSEQRRIVVKIEQLAAKINEARGLRQMASLEHRLLWPATLRCSLIGHGIAFLKKSPVSAKDMLLLASEKHKTTSAASYNNAHPGRPTILEQGPVDLPLEWTWTTLGSVLTHLIDCINDTPVFADHDTGLLGLKSTNVKPYSLDLRDRWFMKPEDFSYWNKREQPKTGDILLTREAPMGQACILPQGHEVCLTQRLMLLRANPEVILPDLLLHVLNSPHFHSQVRAVCRGLTTPHIRVKDAPGFLLPLPPMEIQRIIVDHLETLQSKSIALKLFQQQTAAELDALLPSILDKAFKGEL